MLSKKIAQNIVDKMMEVVPYNINIMNSIGVIIGSGNLDRVGEMHEGAIEAIKQNKIVEIYKDKGKIKSGINIPILFREKIVGTIGITGDVEEVRQFGKIVSITAELLISQEYSINEHIIAEKLKEEFIYEWINYRERYEESFIEKAKSFNIDIDINRTAACIEYDIKNHKECNKIISKIINKDEYFINISSNKVIVLLTHDRYFYKKIEKLMLKLEEFNVKISLGTRDEIINSSVNNAIKALDIGKKLYPSRDIYQYKELYFIHEVEKLLNKKYDDNLTKIIEQSKNNDLIETFLAFMEFNGERTKAANSIHIHRNTLNYRLEKIEEITDLKFDNYIDLFVLIKSYLNYKLTKNRNN